MPFLRPPFTLEASIVELKLFKSHGFETVDIDSSVENVVIRCNQWPEFYLCVTAGVPCSRQIEIECGKPRQTAATAGIDYYRFTTVRRTESII